MVSIIIPCYNSGDYLKETLESVQKQTYSVWECIIVDDGSIDDSWEVAESFCKKDARFHLIRQEHKGVSAARNRGLKQCKGLMIQFLDSDDLMAEEKLSSCVEFLLIHSMVDIVYTGARYFYSDNPKELLILGRNYLSGVIELTMYDVEIFKSVLLRNPFVTSAPLYRKQVFERVGVYDESFQYLEDWDFQIRCAAAGLCFHYLGYRPETATFIRLHTKSLMNDRPAILESKNKLALKHKQIDSEGILQKIRVHHKSIFKKVLRRLKKLINSL